MAHLLPLLHFYLPPPLHLPILHLHPAPLPPSYSGAFRWVTSARIDDSASRDWSMAQGVQSASMSPPSFLPSTYRAVMCAHGRHGNDVAASHHQATPKDGRGGAFDSVVSLWNDRRQALFMFALLRSITHRLFEAQQQKTYI